ncbi:hypothetical protein IPG41_00950 [Candidatus Peregrinibacteria bacterium]|nr:MAG: hypothetical protein IPG41_00950 [Candidatus Peregrinibacteria bacterium]
MKLSTLKISLLTLSLFLSACGSSDELSAPLSREYESYTGTLTSLGSIKVSPIVTHLFETQEGDVLYAFSERYDLDEYAKAMDAYGIVSTYEELDKPLYEITRLTEAKEEEIEAEEVTKVEYRNSELGVVTQIYSNWQVEINDASGLISFKIPHETEETETPETPVLEDHIDLIQFSQVLSSTSESTPEERSTDIKNHVIGNYADLANIVPEQITVGIDAVMGLRYKTSAGNIHVFIPRGSDLLEWSYHYLYTDETLRVQNTNLFSAVLNEFRFITVDEIPAETPDSPAPSSPSVSQVEISKFATLSSNFGFTMSYPAAWYYVGGSTGYSFDDAEIEEVTAEALVRMEFNTGAAEGVAHNGNLVSVTKKVDSRSFTLTGSAEYQNVMQTMLDSIQTIKAE